jgi:hypothetical protein
MKAANDKNGGDEELSHGKRTETVLIGQTKGDSQMAVGAVRAPAKVVLKVLAWCTRTLLEDLARYHLALLLRVPVRARGALRLSEG